MRIWKRKKTTFSFTKQKYCLHCVGPINYSNEIYNGQYTFLLWYEEENWQIDSNE